MKCYNCGSSLKGDSNKCEYCGTIIKEATTEKVENEPVFNNVEYKSESSIKYSGYSIAGIICAFIFPILGLIFSIIGLNKDRQTGNSTTIAVIGIIASIVMFIVEMIVLIIGFTMFENFFDFIFDFDFD